MLFNSMQFAIFLPIVFALYWILPHKCRWIWLLLTSYYFYMGWNIKYIFLIIFTTLVSYVSAIFIEKSNKKCYKRAWLLLSIMIIMGLLFCFKYFNFASNSVVKFLSLFSIQIHPYTLNLLLPVGISFYSFQTMSYVIDTYRGMKPEKHLGKYAAYISFFPQLVAGPIERAENLLPQLHEKKTFIYDNAVYGLKLMAWGFFKKVVIADTLAKVVDVVYGNVTNYNGGILVIATLFFTVQIYCDFSGYSDIAIGVAKLFGIKLMNNFASPYFSKNIKEFWKRWHISLSSFLRDYVYIPLGGSRVRKFRHRINLLITFLISGLWHGANWTFVVWGGLHGMAQIFEAVCCLKIKGNFSRILTFLFCSFAWIFFRVESLGEVGYIISHMFSGILSPINYVGDVCDFLITNMGMASVILILISIIILSIYDYISLKQDAIVCLTRMPQIVRWGVYWAIGMCVLYCGVEASSTQFIYFQF